MEGVEGEGGCQALVGPAVVVVEAWRMAAAAVAASAVEAPLIAS